ncbi:MAG: NERD domain-containing protein [Candidatus Marinimicrobia bacterium]|nr:NERD domain-containing protein [Candidatus Neomarinimicrobiota bacterium]
MAIMIPNRITTDMRATKGEVNTFKALAKGLDNNWFVWYDVGIGNKEIYPDFILIHPQYGILVLEVKDVPFKNLKKIDKINFNTGTYSFKNPIIQAREYVFAAINDKRLKEKIPYQYAVVFANIKSNELKTKIDHVSISDLINENLIFTKGHLTAGKIPSKILSIVGNSARKTNFSKKSFDILRLIIDPSLRVPHRFVKKSAITERDDIPAILDLKQERAAKSIGEGHRLLKGIAGSGKTLIMLYRAKLLAKIHPEWNVLFVCWNRSLINYLGQMYDGIEMDVETNLVQFTYFSKWMGNLAWKNHIPMPKVEDSNQYDYEFNEIAKQLTNVSFSPKYQAILIDEAQDFEEDYFRLLLNHLDDKTNSLLVCYDYAQNLYKKETSWKKLGISVAGRRVLDLSNSKDSLDVNFRNTLEITRFAKFIYNDSIPTKDEDDNIYKLTTISGSPDRGPIPTVQLFKNRFDEYKETINWIIKTKEKNNLSFHDFIIIYPGKRIKNFYLEDEFFDELEKHDIPYTWIAKDQYSKSSFTLHDGAVKVSTIHSAKGMDFEAVAAIACDCISSDKPEAELYTAATRARKYLLMTTGGINHSIEKILDYSYQSSIAWLDQLSNKRNKV